MAAIIAEWMVKKNKHLPQELYIEILSYLLPKHLWNAPEIKKYNKVIQSIPGIEVPSTRPLRIFSSATKSFRTVRYIYKLKRKWKNKPNQYPPPMERNTIAVYVPYTISASRRRTLSPRLDIHHIEYSKYINQHRPQHRAGIVQRQNNRFLKRAKYGWPGRWRAWRR